MPTPPLTDDLAQAAVDAYARHGSHRAAAMAQGIPENTHRHRYQQAMIRGITSARQEANADRILSAVGYVPAAADKTPEQAWAEHAATVDHVLGKAARARRAVIARPRGPYVIAHFTDEHLDDNATPLRLLEQDIKASHALGAVMCHGGDVLNNWPMAGKLAKLWAEQQCTMPDALLRAQHFFRLLDPDAAVHGNHEEMNPYLVPLLDSFLPAKTLRDFWSLSFTITSDGGRDCRVQLSHKFQKGQSWFHRTHGHIHCDGVIGVTMPERGHHALGVASAGYKMLDKFASRISRGGKVPKLRGRAHWIVVDPSADYDADLCMAFKTPQQAEAMLNGLMNLRAA